MAIVKVITSTDLGDGLMISADKLVPQIDTVLTDNLIKINPSEGLAVDPVDVKAVLTFDNELQDLGGTTLGFFNSATNFI